MMDAKEILSKFTHSIRTNLTKNAITNHDACLIVLASLGGIGTKRQLVDGLASWRPTLTWSYLFNTSIHGGYGFVGHDFQTKRCQIGTGWNIYNHYVKSVPYKTETRRTYWYRMGRGTYAITLEGLQRLNELENGATS